MLADVIAPPGCIVVQVYSVNPIFGIDFVHEEKQQTLEEVTVKRAMVNHHHPTPIRPQRRACIYRPVSARPDHVVVCV